MDETDNFSRSVFEEELKQLLQDYHFTTITIEDIINRIRASYIKDQRPITWPPVEYDRYLETLFVTKNNPEAG